MSDNKRKLDIWLYDNHLTEDPNDSFGRVRIAGTINNKGIAARIKKEGSEYQTEAIVEILNRADRICTEAIAEGYAVHTNFVHGKLGVHGAFKDHTYNPSEHSINVVFSPTADLRNKTKDLPVVIMGKAAIGPVIIKVSDSLTKEVNATITPNNALTILGDKIQIEGNLPDVGVYFNNLSDETHNKVTQIISNKNKELIVFIPALVAGDYQLEIVTQFNRGNELLKNTRSVTSDFILTVV